MRTLLFILLLSSLSGCNNAPKATGNAPEANDSLLLQKQNEEDSDFVNTLKDLPVPVK